MRSGVNATADCRDFYLDESGSSGDLVNAGAALDFSRQPVFVLACIGVDDEMELAESVAVVRARHRLQGNELKSVALKNKPAVVHDLIKCLVERSNPIFVEIVDKRFFIVTTMVNHFVIPPVAHEFDSRADVIRMKSDVADYLHAKMPPEVMWAYIDACVGPSGGATRRAFDGLLAWLRGRSGRDGNAKFLLQFAEDSRTDFETAVRDDPESRAFLPVPDAGKAQKLYWMLPNLSSLTNVYARVNLYRRRKMEGVRLIHDEQLQFDHILQGGKRAVERFAAEGRKWPLPHADYGVGESTQLLFGRSHESIGIQVADVVAGFLMRYVQRVNVAAEMPSHDAVRTFQAFLESAEPARGTGGNFVISHGDFARLGLIRA